ncbi:hypothetical protein O181_056494 [Austropuccinia psidii MF-1]|uniref:Uncharacterized protein n=1 Tax=Austropuccinia psidii MF-1 TaxID=1389203 RepID=A0A9Q3E8K5_9BASI|nr:hypothetical protein [Austropuccinia psidii MF-1]
MFHEDLFDCLSADIKGAISKEMIKDNVMVRAEDGGYLIPPMKILKKYIEQELEARILVTKRFSSSGDTGRNVTENKKKVHFKEEAFPAMNEAFSKMKEITESLKEQKLETRKQAQGENENLKKFMTQLEELKNLSQPQMGGFTNQQFKPRNYLPPFSQRHVPYAPAQNIPKPYVKCCYCLEEGHSVNRCNYLFSDQNKKWVSRQVGVFLFPNWQRVPTNGTIAPKKLAEDFEKEQEELTKKMKEAEAREPLPKPNRMNIIQIKKDNSAAAIAKVENWGIWQPPTISSANKPLLNNYGLRNTKERNSRAENTNQDALRSHPKVKTPKKISNIPGAYIEDEKKEEEKTIIPTKYKKPQLVQSDNDRPSQAPKIDHTKDTQESIKKVNERKITKEEKLDIQ